MKEYVRFVECSDSQVHFGGHIDPRKHLIEGLTYEVESKEVHSWHTSIKLVGIPGKFNSVCFETVEVIP